jgi:hypothetical protein
VHTSHLTPDTITHSRGVAGTFRGDTISTDGGSGGGASAFGNAGNGGTRRTAAAGVLYCGRDAPRSCTARAGDDVDDVDDVSTAVDVVAGECSGDAVTTSQSRTNPAASTNTHVMVVYVYVATASVTREFPRPLCTCRTL